MFRITNNIPCSTVIKNVRYYSKIYDKLKKNKSILYITNLDKEIKNKQEFEILIINTVNLIENEIKLYNDIRKINESMYPQVYYQYCENYETYNETKNEINLFVDNTLNKLIDIKNMYSIAYILGKNNVSEIDLNFIKTNSNLIELNKVSIMQIIEKLENNKKRLLNKKHLTD